MKLKPIIITLIFFFLLFLVYPPSFNRSADFLNDKIGLGIPHFPVDKPFKLGLDLLGGAHLVYQADLSQIDNEDVGTVMDGVRDVIERRVNVFGVTEPIVQIVGEDRLIVELAGVTDLRAALDLVQETPILEFKEQRDDVERDAILAAQQNNQRLDEDPFFKPTPLNGRHLTSARVEFDQQNALEPVVALELNSEGAKLFEEITTRNVGKIVGIYIDGIPETLPVVQGPISGGSAIISGGDMTIEGAKVLASRLQAGALPVPINLLSQQTVSASLGRDSLDRSLYAAAIGLVLVSLFMISFYRFSGLVAVWTLLIYVVTVLAVYKLIPVTLTLAGIAGFILSLGMAVDANILIFARINEELKKGEPLRRAMYQGFSRAWLSIRDSHITTLIGAFVLYTFTTSIVKGFALTLGVGVLMSLVAALIITRTFLELSVGTKLEKWPWLFKSFK
jgi:protein-export membrane protein SecD